MNQGVSLDQVSRAIQLVLVQDGRPVLLNDRGAETVIRIEPDSVAARDGLLPALVVAGESVWREATGNGFKLDIRRDPDALLGYRVEAIGAGSFTTVMLSMLEAKAQASTGDGFFVNKLDAIWRGVAERLDHASRTKPVRSATAGVSP